MIKTYLLSRLKQRKGLTNPWIIKGILRSIHIRNRLFKLTKTNPSVINLNKYKRYRNKLTSVIRLARKTYYSNEMKKNKNNTNSVWKLINTLIGGKNSKIDNTDTFCHNDIQYRPTNPTEVCNSFNNYFTNIGPNLAEQINTRNGHFTQYLSPGVPTAYDRVVLMIVPNRVCFRGFPSIIRGHSTDSFVREFRN